MDGLIKFLWSYEFYFSSLLFVGISILTAAVRVFQALYREKLGKPTHYLIEFLVGILRFAQYVLFVCIGTSTSIHDILSVNLWDKIFLALNKITFPEIIWSIAGFIIIFGIYNLILYVIFKKAAIEYLMNKYRITKFPLPSIQQALLLGFKNLLLIPVSVIYLLNLLNILS